MSEESFEKNSRQFARRLIGVGVFTLITALVWVSLDGYNELVKQQRLKEIKSLLRPLNPEINTEVLMKTRERREYSLEAVDELLILPTPTLEPTPTLAEEGSGGEQGGRAGK